MQGSRVILVLAGLAASGLRPLPACAAADPTPKGWLTYINTKYDFDICYPASLRAQPPAQAGDGQVFTGPGSGRLSVFWRPGTAGDTLAKTADGEAAGMGPSPSITYAAAKPGWAVRSGRSADAIFYVKVLQRDSDYLIMEVRYPAAEAKTWNGLSSHFAACFESSRPH